jgi:hypothetical protein
MDAGPAENAADQAHSAFASIRSRRLLWSTGLDSVVVGRTGEAGRSRCVYDAHCVETAGACGRSVGEDVETTARHRAVLRGVEQEASLESKPAVPHPDLHPYRFVRQILTLLKLEPSVTLFVCAETNLSRKKRRRKPRSNSSGYDARSTRGAFAGNSC